MISYKILLKLYDFSSEQPHTADYQSVGNVIAQFSRQTVEATLNLANSWKATVYTLPDRPRSETTWPLYVAIVLKAFGMLL